MEDSAFSRIPSSSKDLIDRFQEGDHIPWKGVLSQGLSVLFYRRKQAQCLPTVTTVLTKALHLRALSSPASTQTHDTQRELGRVGVTSPSGVVHGDFMDSWQHTTLGLHNLSKFIFCFYKRWPHSLLLILFVNHVFWAAISIIVCYLHIVFQGKILLFK